MAHPGELDRNRHPFGITDALEPAYVIRFPLSGPTKIAVEKRGGLVDDVSVGQEVILPNGASYAHGTDDGLHRALD